MINPKPKSNDRFGLKSKSKIMAKYIPIDTIKSMSGKVCGHSDISFAKKGETLYTMKRCNERSSEPTEKELAQRAKFGAISAAVNARLKAKDPADVAAYEAQKKYKSFRSYLWALESEAYTPGEENLN